MGSNEHDLSVLATPPYLPEPSWKVSPANLLNWRGSSLLQALFASGKPAYLAIILSALSETVVESASWIEPPESLGAA